MLRASVEIVEDTNDFYHWHSRIRLNLASFYSEILYACVALRQEYNL